MITMHNKRKSRIHAKSEYIEANMISLDDAKKKYAKAVENLFFEIQMQSIKTMKAKEDLAKASNMRKKNTK